MTDPTAPVPGTPAVTTRVTRYELSCIPEDNINHSAYLVTVEYRGDELWGVFHGGRWCLGTDGAWDWEPSPSSRDDEWLGAHRFDLSTALQVAQQAAPNVTVNGWTVADVLAKASTRSGRR